MSEVKHLTMEELYAGLDHILKSPADKGKIELIVCRPAEGERQILQIAELDISEGLVGDNWITRGSRRTKDGSAHPEMQLNIMNVRAVDLIANDKSRWPLAGDQFYVDFDLSESNVPAGTLLKLGTAIIEVTPVPHNGCKKFVERYGLDAMKFVNSKEGKAHHLRGINAKVIQPGTVKVGDMIEKVESA